MTLTALKPTPATEPVATYEVITPLDALEMLTGNTCNRSLRHNKVSAYAGDMKRGAWTFNNDAITFSDKGTLLNGQHRLHAIIESETTQRLLVLRGCPIESMSAMDTGARRTAGDYFGQAGLGEQNSNILTSAIKQIILLDSGRTSADRSGQQITNSVMEAWLTENPSVRESVAAAVRHNSGARRIMTAPRILASTHFLIARENSPEVADYFFSQIASRAGEPAGSAVHAVANRLTEVHLSKTQIEPKYIIAMMLRGWNSYARGRQVTRMPVLKTDPFQVPTILRATAKFGTV